MTVIPFPRPIPRPQELRVERTVEGWWSASLTDDGQVVKSFDYGTYQEAYAAATFFGAVHGLETTLVGFPGMDEVPF